jgi:hypothetical protein
MMGNLDDDRPRRRSRENDEERGPSGRRRSREDSEDEEDDRERRRPRAGDDHDDDDEEVDGKRKSKRKSSPGHSRVYVHDACGGETEISGDDFARVANPFAWVSQTYCASCERFAGLGRFSWADTDETLTDYRRRLRRRAPLSLKLWGWVFGPLIGAGICAISGFLLATNNRRGGAITGGVVGVVIFPLFLIQYLSKWIWGIDYRRKK